MVAGAWWLLGAASVDFVHKIVPQLNMGDLYKKLFRAWSRRPPLPHTLRRRARGTATTLPAPRDTIQPLKHTRTHTPPPRGRNAATNFSPGLRPHTPSHRLSRERRAGPPLSLHPLVSHHIVRSTKSLRPSVSSHTRVFFSYKLREVFVHVVVVAVALQVLARDEVLNPLLDLLRVGLEVSAQRETQREGGLCVRRRAVRRQQGRGHIQLRLLVPLIAFVRSSLGLRSRT